MTEPRILKIKVLADCPNREMVINYYKNHKTYSGDSGLNLIFPKKYYCPANDTTTCKLGIACEFPTGYFMIGRSSLSNTPLILHNSIGLIDKGYRGELMAKFYCTKHVKHYTTSSASSPMKYLAQYASYRSERHYLITETSLLQICAPDLAPFEIRVVDELDETERGDKGFGSTNEILAAAAEQEQVRNTVRESWANKQANQN